MRAARETLGLVAAVFTLSACEGAAPETNPPRNETQAPSAVACTDQSKPPRMRGEQPFITRSADSLAPHHIPVMVDIALEVAGITGIDELSNSFEVQGFMTLVWCDPRLRDRGGPALVRTFLDEKADEKLENIWRPDLAFVNAMTPVNVHSEALDINSHGTVTHKRRFDLVLQAKYDLHKFPFDRQTLDILIESFTWPEDTLRLYTQRLAPVAFAVPPGWRSSGDEERFITNPAQKLKETHRKLGNQSNQKRLKGELASLGVTYSTFTMSLPMAREGAFYSWKLILPLVLIVFMSWAVFWADPKELSDRVGLTFTAILTVVAFQFLISDQLPRVSYQTYMDLLLLTSFVFMIFTVAESVLVNKVSGQGRDTLAAAIDRNCRWGFPLGYVAALGVISAAALL